MSHKIEISKEKKDGMIAAIKEYFLNEKFKDLFEIKNIGCPYLPPKS